MGKHLRLGLALLIFSFAIFSRVQLFQGVGKDIYAYEKAVIDLIEGRNPYTWTVESFSNPDDPGNHGFAYLPALMYINIIGYLIHLLSPTISLAVLWKIPILLADIGVGILIVKFFKDKPWYLSVLGLLVWFFNPYFYLKSNYVYTDPLPIFFMFLSLWYLKKDSVVSGASFAFAVGLKTFPILLLPLMFIKSKTWKQFLVAIVIVGLALSAPFLRSWEMFSTFINGSLLIHGERFVQGRPFLFYISYFYKVELFQIIPLWVYTVLASFLGWLLVPIIYYFTKIKNEYVLSLVPFVSFYVFTPVLNRTYLMWFLPLLVVGLYNLVDKYINFKHKKWGYVFLVCLFWVFNYHYLAIWKDGFHIWRP